MAQNVQKISCANDAAFVMYFWIEWIDSDSGELHWTQGNSGNYPVGQQRTTDMANLGELGPNPGDLVRPHVGAILGTNNPGNNFVRYTPNSPNVATYNVTGTTFNYSVSLVS
jgi:hypothetical protein